MDFDNDSPFARHFIDDSFTVRSNGDHYQDAILWMSFNFDGGGLNLRVYDPTVRSYTHQFEGSSSADVDAFIRGVEKDFGMKVPKNFRTLPKEFLPLIGDAFSISEELDEITYCEGCFDSNGSTLTAFYFPPITDDGSASLSLYWRFGCYGGEGTYGAIENTKDDILAILDRAIDTANDSDEFTTAVEQVKEFKAKVLAL